MARNSVTGRFRDIEILFSLDGDATIMSVRNLVNDERKVRVMYQKLSMSGLANWAQFQLTDTPVSRRLPTEILEAYRLTFFVDDADPISARIEKILVELDSLKSESSSEIQEEVSTPVLEAPEDAATLLAVSPLEMSSNGDERPVSEVEATQQVEEVGTPDTQEVYTLKSVLTVPMKNEQDSEEKSASTGIVPEPSTTQNAEPVFRNLDSTNLEFKITVPSLPSSVLAAKRKAQMAAQPSAHRGTISSKPKQKGVFGQLVQALGLTAGGRRGKAYYQQKGEAIQNEFQDQLAKLERDYNEGYGLNLHEWDPDTLCEAEVAILLMNLMVSEVIAWQKETGRATPETERLVQTLAEVDASLRQTLKQTRGVSTPSPTLFPDLLAENDRDLEKIQNECDAYLHRFAGKLIEQEKAHAEKIEVLIFKKFLIEFIRDFLFVEVAESTRGNELPERLHWFLDLVNSEVIPIEVGKTKVSSNHHKVKDARPSEFEAGTIVEVLTAGLQSKDGKRVSQMAVVIEAE